MTEPRQFPILWQGNRAHFAELERLGCPRSIPWAVIAPHEAQARQNHGGQTLERLAQRGGLCPCEAAAVFKGEGLRFALSVSLEDAVAILRDVTARAGIEV